MRQETFETIMEAVCDACHCPHVLDQETLDAVCENCPAEKKIRAMENSVRDLTGMRAVLTFQALQRLWNWKTIEELEAVQVFLEALIDMERRKA